MLKIKNGERCLPISSVHKHSRIPGVKYKVYLPKNDPQINFYYENSD